MVLLRALILAVGITLGTVLVGWWIIPFLAAAFGALQRNDRAPGLLAALSAALGWGGYLAVVAMGGGPVAAFAGALATSMKLPGWAPLLATLVFPALLAAPAAYLGARVGGRYLSPA